MICFSILNCLFCFSIVGYNSNDLSAASDESITLVHQNVPNSTSEALGVPTLMSKMLDAEELDYSFGQADSLTSRLNALLQEYTDGFAVPKGAHPKRRRCRSHGSEVPL